MVTVNPVLNIWPGDSTIDRDVAHHRQESAPTEPSSHHHNNNISKYRPGAWFKIHKDLTDLQKTILAHL